MDGDLWFTEGPASKIGRIATTGSITEFALRPDRRPAGITAGPDGNLWFTQSTPGAIARITTGGSIKRFPLPNPKNRPHAIALGADDNLWFTESGANRIGRITPAGKITQFRVPAPYGTGAIATGPNGEIWFTANYRIGSANIGSIFRGKLPTRSPASIPLASSHPKPWRSARKEVSGLAPGSNTPVVVGAPTSRSSTAPRLRGEVRTSAEELVNRGARIRTGDLRHPKAARYQAAPRPEAPSVERRPAAGTAVRFGAMADVRPLNALHYDLDAVGSLQDVVAPPYDVIDAGDAAGAARALALQRGRDRPAQALRRDRAAGRGPRAIPTRARPRRSTAWQQAGALVKDTEPAIWAMEQEYTGPDGGSHIRHGILARVRVEDFETGQVLPHERTLPGPKQDRLELSGRPATTSRRSSR